MSHRTFKVVDPYDAASPDEGMSVKPGEILEEMSNSDAAEGDEFVLCKKQDGQEGYVPYDVIAEVTGQQPPMAPSTQPSMTATKTAPGMSTMTQNPKAQFSTVVTAEADSFKDLFEKHE